MSTESAGRSTYLMAHFCHCPGTGGWALDIALRAGGIHITSGPGPDPAMVAVRFPNAWDAARAAVDMMAAAGRMPHTATHGDGCGPRIALCDDETACATAGPLSRVAQLLSRTAVGQIRLTASTAVVAGPTLPPGTDLVDCGGWLAAPGERLYVLRLDPHGGTRRAPSNLDWARRTAVGTSGLPEHAALVSAWRRAVVGQPQMVMLTGDTVAATGTVSAELALRLHAEGALVLYGRWDREARTPWQAFREALGVYADSCTTAELRTDLEGWAGEIARLLPEVAARVGDPHLARRPVWAAAPPRLPEAVEAWLLAIVRRRPTLLVLDEAQWADRSSIALLTRLWHAQRRGSLMVVVTVSPDARDLGTPGADNGLDRLAALIGTGTDDAVSRLLPPVGAPS